MKLCAYCQKEYANKRDTSRFCSDKCRVAYNRKNPKKGDAITPVQMQVLYNSIMGAIRAINERNNQPIPGATIIIPVASKEAEYGYNELMKLIESATSAAELAIAWKKVEKTEGLAKWHLNKLTQAKEEQRTKIDF